MHLAYPIWIIYNTQTHISIRLQTEISPSIAECFIRRVDILIIPISMHIPHTKSHKTLFHLNTMSCGSFSEKLNIIDAYSLNCIEVLCNSTLHIHKTLVLQRKHTLSRSPTVRHKATHKQTIFPIINNSKLLNPPIYPSHY